MGYFTPLDGIFLLLVLLTGFIIFKFIIEIYLLNRQIQTVFKNRFQVPELFKDFISLEAHQKAADYTIAKAKFSRIQTIWTTILLLSWTVFFGLIFRLEESVSGFLSNYLNIYESIWPQIVFIISFSIISTILDLPFSLYETFKLEQKFGFNKMTFKLWLIDGFKGLILSLIIGIPFIYFFVWLIREGGNNWWIWAFILLCSFQLFMMWIFPVFIAPLFNKFEPLKDENLVKKISDLMQRCGFKNNGLFVMDGSQRSSHANAYFTGFGSSKRVVFFDTLLNKLTPDEIEAVLAHELGHFKYKHIIKRIVLVFILSFFGLYLLDYLSQLHYWFLREGLLLVLFMLILPVFTFWFSPISSYFSRKDEFQADGYAIKNSNGSSLANALLKLHEDNASTLTPDNLYVKFYYSHPPALERLSKIPKPVNNNL